MRTRRPLPPFVGLDLSLTAPAACCIPRGWRIGDWGALDVVAWEPPKVEDQGDQGALYARLTWIVDAVAKFVSRSTIHEVPPVRPVVSAEQYAFSRSSSSVTKLAELGGAVRVDLWRRRIVVCPLVASSARKLLLGKLPKKGAKDATQFALWEAGAPKTWSGDILDSFAISNLALSDYGAPALTLATGAGPGSRGIGC
jgi:hypothetical protein